MIEFRKSIDCKNGLGRKKMTHQAVSRYPRLQKERMFRHPALSVRFALICSLLRGNHAIMMQQEFSRPGRFGRRMTDP